MVWKHDAFRAQTLNIFFLVTKETFQQINIWNQNVFLFINSNKKGLGEISKKYFNLCVEDYFVGYKT